MIRNATAIRALVVFFVCLPGILWAQGVRAGLSSSNARVGEVVDYTLTVEGAYDVDDAPVPQVDGLEVRGTSHGTQLSIINTKVSRRTTITHRLVPTREGTFKIPPMEVEVEGQKYRTPELSLTVAAGTVAAEAGDLAFAEIRLSKKTAYLGEAIPVEIRIYLGNEAQWDLRSQPTLAGSGFHLKPFERLSQRQVEMAGKGYVAAIFQSLLTPGKAGKMTIGPLNVKTVYSQRARSRNSFFPSFGPAQELEVTGPPIELDVQLLPSEGRPASFAGAVGNFQLSAAGTPNKVNVGEPVQMVVSLRGQGNFARIDVPPLANPEGWQVYKDENEFESADEIGFSGTKTFRLPIAPTKRQNQMPVFAFSYFDPEAKKYQTLTTATLPLTVTGADLAPSPAVPNSPTADTPAPAPPAPPATADILGILPDASAASFPTLKPHLAIILAAAPFPLLLAFALWYRRSHNSQRLRRAELERQKSDQWQIVRAARSKADVYDASARVLQVQAALALEREPNSCELPEILSAGNLSPTLQRDVEELFQARSLLLYAGGTREEDALTSRERDHILEVLSQYARSVSR